MSQRSKQTVARILVLVFALYYADICFFYHSHIIHGTTIVHSHFHNQSHTQSGTHGDSELTLIAGLSAFQSPAVASFIASVGIFFLLLAVILPPSGKRTAGNLITAIPPRAPPAFS